jgi:hypothetical protein
MPLPGAEGSEPACFETHLSSFTCHQLAQKLPLWIELGLSHNDAFAQVGFLLLQALQQDPCQRLYLSARGSNLVYLSNEQIMQLATLERRQYNPTLALRITAINEGDSARATLGESPAWDGLSRMCR